MTIRENPAGLLRSIRHGGKTTSDQGSPRPRPRPGTVPPEPRSTPPHSTPSNGDARSKSLISPPPPSPNQQARTRSQRPITLLHMPRAALRARAHREASQGQRPNTGLHGLRASPQRPHCHLLPDHRHVAPGVLPDSPGPIAQTKGSDKN